MAKQCTVIVKGKIEFPIFNNIIYDILSLYNDIATYTKDEDILLAEEDSNLADDTEMLSAEESEGHIQSFALANRRDNIDKKGDSRVSLRTFIDVDPSETN